MRLAAAGVFFAAVLLTAGCGGSRRAAPTTSSSPPTTTSGACVLSAAQRHDISAALREIALMHRLERPLKTVHETGSPALENAVNRFLLDVGPLPPLPKGRLMDLAKSAVGLCHDCFNAIEAEEPTLQTRLGRPPCVGR